MADRAEFPLRINGKNPGATVYQRGLNVRPESIFG